MHYENDLNGIHDVRERQARDKLVAEAQKVDMGYSREGN